MPPLSSRVSGEGLGCAVAIVTFVFAWVLLSRVVEALSLRGSIPVAFLGLFLMIGIAALAGWSVAKQIENSRTARSSSEAERTLSRQVEARRRQAENRDLLRKAGCIIGVHSYSLRIRDGGTDIPYSPPSDPEPAYPLTDSEGFCEGSFANSHLRIVGTRSKFRVSYGPGSEDKELESRDLTVTEKRSGEVAFQWHQIGMGSSDEAVSTYVPGKWEIELERLYTRVKEDYPLLKQKAKDNRSRGVKKQFGL